MLSVTCVSCRQSGQVPDQFAGKRIRCVACGHRFRVETVPSPEAETSVEVVIPEGLLVFDEPGRKALHTRTTEFDVFVAPLLARRDQPPYRPSETVC